MPRKPLEPEVFTPEPAPQPSMEVTTTRAGTTPEMTQIEQERQNLVASQLGNLQAQQQDLAARQAEELTLQEQQAKIEQEMAQDKAAREREIADQTQAEMADIDSRIASLMEQKPKSFWQDKSTGDKVLMSLAILVGSIGQGLSGAKENAAIKALERAVDNDLQMQESHLNRQLQLLDRQRGSAKDKAAQRRELLNQADAKQIATLGQVRAQIEQLRLRTKHAQAKTTLDTLATQIQDQELKARADIEKERAGQITSKSVVVQQLPDGRQILADPQAAEDPTQAALDNMAQYASTSPSLAGGKAQNPTQQQANAKQFIALNELAAKQLDEIENSLTEEEFSRIHSAMSYVNRLEVLKGVPILGVVAGYTQEATGETPKELFEDAVPGRGGRYYQALKTLSNNQVRIVSGSAVAQSEEAAEAFKLAPSVGTNFQDIGDMQLYRHRLLQSNRDLAKINKPLWFERVEK